MVYTLPTTVTLGETEYRIRTDFRVILEILDMLADPDLDSSEHAQAMLEMFYIDVPTRHFEDALKECVKFIDLGKESDGKKKPRLVDMAQDFEYIIAPINRVLGKEIRAIPYNSDTNEGGLHWWTFMSAYMEIGGDCLFSQIVSMRDKIAHHKKLEKHEREWLNKNREIVTLKTRYSVEDEEMLKKFVGGKVHE